MLGTASCKAVPKCTVQFRHRANKVIWEDRQLLSFFFFKLYIVTGQKSDVKLGHVLPLCAALQIPRCHKCPEMGNTLAELGG